MAHTRRLLLSFALCSLLTSLASGQRWTHAPTIGVNPSRDSHYSYVDAFGPPFILAATDLLGGAPASGFFPIEDGFLVPSSDGAYRFWSRSGQQSGEASLVWSTTAVINALPPAYSRGIVILSSSNTTSVQAVSLEDGQALWSGPGVGDLNRSPVASADTVFFQGNHRLLAAGLDDGTLIWERVFLTSFANAPLALSNGLLFVLDRAGTLHALSARSGDEVWRADETGGVDSTVVATSDLVFVTRYNRITALATTTGTVQWERVLPGGFTRLAYAQGRLFATFPPPGFHGMPTPGGTANTIVALEAKSGIPTWEFREEAHYPPPIPVTPAPYWSVISDLFVADSRVYFFNGSLGRVRTLDTATGTLEWSMKAAPGLQSMKLSDRELVLLYGNRIEMYRPVQRLFLSEFAAGEGYSIRLTVNNSHDEPADASIVFRSTSGDELIFRDSAGMPLDTNVSVPPFSCATLIIPDGGQPVETGWVQIDSAVPLTANLVFQYAPGGVLKNEVGVGDSPLTDFANVKVSNGNAFSTAVALAVPGDQEAAIFVQLLDDQGAELARNDLSLGSQKQIAKFFHELLDPDLSFNAFEGTLVIRADQPIAVTALRTKDGTPISSFPVGLPR